MRRIALATAYSLLVLAAAVVAAAWLQSRDPVAALPRADSTPAVTEDWRERWEGRTLHHVSLHCGAAGRARFVVSLPEPVPEGPIPIVVVRGGLGRGSDRLREITAVSGA